MPRIMCSIQKNNNQDKDGVIAEMVIERKNVFAAWGAKGKVKELIILI